MTKREALEKWRRDVGAHRDESQWFYEQAEANECARIILAEQVVELQANIKCLENTLSSLEEES